MGSPTRHCQIAECSESIGRSHASGLAIASSGLVSATSAARAAPRHHEMAGHHERLLVRGRDDLAGAQRRQHGPQRDDAARGDDDEIDVVARGELERAVAAVGWRTATVATSSRRACAAISSRLRARRQRHDLEAIAQPLQDVDRLASDDPGRPEERDPRSCRAYRTSAATYSVTTGAANRNESVRSRMPPWPGMSVPESLAPAARLSIDSARSPACAASPSSGPRIRAWTGSCPIHRA